MEFNHGDKVICEINGNRINDAIIVVEGGYQYICHNNERCDGAAPRDKLGYSYGWVLEKDFTDRQLTNLVIKEEKIENISDEMAKDILDFFDEAVEGKLEDKSEEVHIHVPGGVLGDRIEHSRVSIRDLYSRQLEQLEDSMNQDEEENQEPPQLDGNEPMLIAEDDPGLVF